jgi:anti-sigma factor RsiW
MTCGHARRLLWPDTGPQEATAEIVAAHDHASRCPVCQRFLDDMRRLSDQIREAMPRPEAPMEVRDRLFKAIARARTAPVPPIRAAWIRRTARSGLAAVLLLGLSLGSYLIVRDGESDRRNRYGTIAADQLRSRKGAGLVSSDSLQVADWLAERLPLVVQVPLFPEARLTGARLLVDDEKSGAVVEYAAQGRRLTYSVLPGGGTGLPRQVRLGSRDGYRVASWHDAGLTHALVATLPGPKLIEYARYCIHQMVAS